MKENKYNDPDFYSKYAEMSRSKEGLDGAGEWSELQKILPEFSGKNVLDLGCGYGWHCKYAADAGAKYVLGTDISNKMLKTAEDKNAHPVIEYQCTAMEDLKIQDETFDIIMSSLAFHYIRAFSPLLRKIYRGLKSNGEFIFSVEHPIFTSEGSQDWHYNQNGDIQHFPVDNYYFEGQRNTLFLDEPVTKYHRTLTTYLNTLLRNGFELQYIVEPQPPDDMMDRDRMKDDLRRPMMLIISARKK